MRQLVIISAIFLSTLFMSISNDAFAQFDSEKCTACTNPCPRTDPHCGQLGKQYCGLWSQSQDNWVNNTVRPYQCVNCPRTDPECSPYRAKPATAPANFSHHCTECTNPCPRTDPLCGLPGTQYCGLADRDENAWVDGTVFRYSCNPRGRFGSRLRGGR